jgi:hypothetical protein
MLPRRGGDGHDLAMFAIGKAGHLVVAKYLPIGQPGNQDSRGAAQPNKEED